MSGGTAAAGGSSSSSTNQFPATVERSNNCLYLVKQLRAHALKTQQHLFSGEDGGPPTEKSAKALFDQLDKDYNMLETYAKSLPPALPAFDRLDKMRALFQDEELEEHNSKTTIDAMVDAGNYNEGNYQIFYYLTEFLRGYSRRRPSTMIPRELPSLTTEQRHGMSPHMYFEDMFAQVQKDFATRKQGIYTRYLERNGTGSVIELRFGVFVEKQIVVTLKMLMVELNGVIERVQFVAPHEDWKMDEHGGQKKVDLTHESRYLVYRKLTTQGNLHLMVYINQQTQCEIKTAQHLSQIFYVFSRFSQIFEAQGRTCKKVMRDFLPPLIFDFRNPKAAAIHEACR